MQREELQLDAFMIIEHIASLEEIKIMVCQCHIFEADGKELHIPEGTLLLHSWPVRGTA